MLFGEFLFLKCIVDEETLLKALGEQVRVRPLLGEIAVQEGYMSAWDVYRVINEQSRSHRYFGDIALELGLVSREELDSMLVVQQKNTPPLGEILVNRGVISPEDLSTLLQDFSVLKARHESGKREEHDRRESA